MPFNIGIRPPADVFSHCYYYIVSREDCRPVGLEYRRYFAADTVSYNRFFRDLLPHNYNGSAFGPLRMDSFGSERPGGHKAAAAKNPLNIPVAL